MENAKREATNPPDNCLTCHMPKRTVATIAHAALTDHSIPAKASKDLQPLDQNHRDQKPELLLLTAPPADWPQLESVPPAILFQAYDSLVVEGHQEFEPLLERLLPQIASHAGSDPAVLRALARAEFRKHTEVGNQKALEYMKRVRRSGPPNVDDDLFVSNLYIRTKQDRQAVNILERARMASPYFREIYENLAAEYMELGQYRDALAVLNRGIELFPDDGKLRDLQQKASAATLTGP
jgi:tetratricopeptide (TPR) repeat protein